MPTDRVNERERLWAAFRALALWACGEQVMGNHCWFQQERWSLVDAGSGREWNELLWNQNGVTLLLGFF